LEIATIEAITNIIKLSCAF